MLSYFLITRHDLHGLSLNGHYLPFCFSVSSCSHDFDGQLKMVLSITHFRFYLRMRKNPDNNRKTFDCVAL